MKQKLCILGWGGHGQVVADIATVCEVWSEIIFFDDQIDAKESQGYLYGGNFDAAIEGAEASIDNISYVVAVGNSKLRESFVRILVDLGASVANVIHPSAIFSNDIEIA